MIDQVTGPERVMRFLEGIAAGIAVLAALAFRSYLSGAGLRPGSSELTKGDWTLLAVVYGAIVVTAALTYALR